MIEYALRLDNGQIITDPGWHSPADVMHSFHGFGARRGYGTLIKRAQPEDEWEEA